MKDQRGFAHFLLLVLVVIGVGAVGLFVFSRIKDSSKSSNSDSSESLVASDTLYFEEGMRLQPSDFGVASGLPVADVSAVRLPDKTWRIYAFAQNRGIVSAVSEDGLSFTPEAGERLADGAGMPRIVKLDDGSFRIYFIEMGGIGSATSSDGITFVKESGMRINPPGGVSEISGISTPQKLRDGKWRVYFSDLPRPGAAIKPHKVYSATSTDLVNWQLDEGHRIGDGKVSSSAEHPDTIVDDNGNLIIYYFVNDERKLMTASSTDGLNFSDPQQTGLDCNDPNIVSLVGSGYRIYCGDFDQSIGGYVKSAKLTQLPNIP